MIWPKNIKSLETEFKDKKRKKIHHLPEFQAQTAEEA